MKRYKTGFKRFKDRSFIKIYNDNVYMYIGEIAEITFNYMVERRITKNKDKAIKFLNSLV